MDSCYVHTPTQCAHALLAVIVDMGVEGGLASDDAVRVFRQVAEFIGKIDDEGMTKRLRFLLDKWAPIARRACDARPARRAARRPSRRSGPTEARARLRRPTG